MVGEAVGAVRDIILKVIPARTANEFVQKYHYSKSFVRNSKLHFGAFLDGKLHGVLQFGNSIDKRNCIGFVDTGLSVNAGWNSFLELNRMAFDEYLPKNSESRCLGVALRLIAKNAPHIKWILTYADGTQCGDGTIYRAANFQLCGIKKNTTIHTMKDGSSKAKHGTSKADFRGSKPKPGFQLRYIYLIDRRCKILLPVLPYSAIEQAGAKMYKGKRPGEAEKDTRGSSSTGRASDVLSEEGVQIHPAAQTPTATNQKPRRKPKVTKAARGVI